MIRPDASRPARTLPQLLADAVERHGDRRLVIDDRDRGTLTYRDAGALVGTLARRLLDEGFGPGDVVLACAPTHPEGVLFFWAAASVGLVFVPLDYEIPAAELQRIAPDIKPRIALCDRKRLPIVRELKCDLLLVVDDECEDPLASPAVSFARWMGQVSEPPTALPEVAPEDTAIIIFTSGTTGNRRGVEISHGALCRSGEVVVASFGWRPDDLLLGLGDMDGISGLRNPCVATLQAGCACVLTAPERRDSFLSMVERIREHRCTLVCTGPATLRQLVAHSSRIDATDLASLRQFISVASALSPDTTAQIHSLYEIPVLNTWGMTETSGLCIAVPHDQARPGFDTIGIPVGCTAEIVDDDGAPVGPGEIGELRVTGETLMSGYLNAPEATARVVRDGWLYTGDLVRARADGWLAIAGRRSEFVKTSLTHRVHPSEVEDALQRHEAVAEAGACGFVSRFGDEQLAAFVVPTHEPQDPDGLTAELRRHLLADLGPHKAPRILRLADELPRDRSGTLSRRALAEMLEQE